ncbi:hypothetical protein ACWT_0513 [Actinoplanes sp. SE50]|nr:hypothetical protein ACPL_629 [Actinoplanes sp. SE50/110]ATO79928.1 hypothetical protein ACWT_0513 [Actinoplanes sp. SE50]SLL97330.1 hypothetical protein ACSP50_0531 [Actinoplanes sp. SE50/110]
MLVISMLAACSARPAAPAWTRITLPGGERATLRDAAACGDRWYVVGAVPDGDDTRPAAWSSPDTVTWTPVTFAPLPDSFYGPHEVISTVACAGDRVTMLGGAPGGAHGNLRISTWRRLPDGRMAENPAPFATYGGDTAVDTEHLAAGPAGFAVAGNRSSGAAAWLSPDGAGFRLFENAPGLAGPGTAARDAVPLPTGGWAVLGSRNGHAAAWITVDGSRWTGDDPPAAGGFTELQRGIPDGADLLAIGPHDRRLAVWRRHDGTWSALGDFGTAPTGVASLTRANGRFIAAGDGLWSSVDARRWRAVDVPENIVAVAGRDRLLLAVAAGTLYVTTP